MAKKRDYSIEEYCKLISADLYRATDLFDALTRKLMLESRVPTTDAPEMTVGDSGSVSEIYTDETAGECIQLVSCICPKCGTTWSEPVLPPVKTTKQE